MARAGVRRGQPPAHGRARRAHQEHGFRGDAQDFGRSVAILLGDLAHTWAIELFTGAERPRELTRRSSAAREEVIGGQYLELLVAQRRVAREEELLRVLRLKSGCYTAERPIQRGAPPGGAPG